MRTCFEAYTICFSFTEEGQVLVLKLRWNIVCSKTIILMYMMYMGNVIPSKRPQSGIRHLGFLGFSKTSENHQKLFKVLKSNKRVLKGPKM